jgi:hypothetical protein
VAHPDLVAALATARATWMQAKPMCRIYKYNRMHVSFTGWTATTTIKIEDDRPTLRSYVAQENRFGMPDAGPNELWTEIDGAIGSHGSGDPALTVEQLFAQCDSIVASNPGEHITLNTNADGVATSCSFRPQNCADDCDMGFWLSGFDCAAAPPRDGGSDGAGTDGAGD